MEDSSSLIIENLVDMGFPRKLAQRAALVTKDEPGEHRVMLALEYALAHRDDEDVEDTTPSSSESESTPLLHPSQPSNGMVNGERLLYARDDASSPMTRALDRMSTVVDRVKNHGVRETFYCHICFENVDVAKGFKLSRCGHMYCKDRESCGPDCSTADDTERASGLRGYVTNKIREGQVYMKCFYESDGGAPCDETISPADIEALVSRKTLVQYGRFKAKRENPNMVECPKCEHLEEGDPDHPATVCSQCSHAFCMIHQDMHPPTQTCAEYEHEHQKELKIARAALAKLTKPCPHCKAPVEKAGGCNHIKCLVCGTNFCWLCGQEVDEDVLPNHYKWWNLCGCPGMQMNESMASWAPWKMFLFRLLYVIVALTVGPVALAITTVVMSLCLCCWLPLCAIGDSKIVDIFIGCFTCAGYVIIFGLSFAAMIPLVVILCPCILIYAVVFGRPESGLGGGAMQDLVADEDTDSIAEEVEAQVAAQIVSVATM